MPEISPNTRLRLSPFFDATREHGVDVFSIYNRMLLPVSYGEPELEYRRLLTGVSQWDVAVQRQVWIRGADAAYLAQILSVRDLSDCAVGQAKYVPMCDHRGVLVNDPVVLKLDHDHYWFSIADNNILLWARSIAFERKLSVEISEPDISPMAVQGPKAEEVMAEIFGYWVRDLKYFRFRDAGVDGIPLKILRAGYSGQDGFELFLMDGSRGRDLWNIVREAGRPWDIGPGAPNPVERIESGLLSYGGDTDDNTNPFEVRLGKYVSLDLDDSVIGIRALRDIAGNGAVRHQLGVKLAGLDPHPAHAVWYDVLVDGREVGKMTNGGWSPRLQGSIGFVLISTDLGPGDAVTVRKDGRPVPGTLCELPFI